MTATKPKKMKRRRLAEHVIERLQEWISLGRFAPGERLPPEDALTELLGVSRTTLREGVGVLAHAGLLDVRQGDGTYVRSATKREESLDRRLQRAAALEVYEVRRVLELATAQFAAERRTDGDLERMRRHLLARDRARERGEIDALVDADIAFHLEVAVATGNPVLADLFRAFAGALRDTVAAVVRDPVASEDTSGDHHRLVDAISQRDPAAAVEVTRQLLEADARALRSALARP